MKSIQLKRTLIILLLIGSSVISGIVAFKLSKPATSIDQPGIKLMLMLGMTAASGLLSAVSGVAAPVAPIVWSFTDSRRRKSRKRQGLADSDGATAGGPDAPAKTPASVDSRRTLHRRAIVIVALAAGAFACALFVELSVPEEGSEPRISFPTALSVFALETALMASIPALLVTWTARAIWRRIGC